MHIVAAGLRAVKGVNMTTPDATMLKARRYLAEGIPLSTSDAELWLHSMLDLLQRDDVESGIPSAKKLLRVLARSRFARQSVPRSRKPS